MDDEEAIPVTHLIYMVVEALVKHEVICLDCFVDLVVPNSWSVGQAVGIGCHHIERCRKALAAILSMKSSPGPDTRSELPCISL